MMQSRVLGLDVGEARIGVAVSDALGLTAQGVETIASRGAERDIARVMELIGQYDAVAVICGLPRNMDGSEGFQAQRVRAFADPLTARGVRVIFQDERLTTASARRTLIEADVRRKSRKGVIDKLAACYILQGFLDGGGLSTLVKHQEDSPMEDGVMRDENSIVELVDEDGKPVKFEHLMTLDFDGGDYIVLAPIDDIDGIGDDEVVILKIEEGDTEEDEVYVGVEDEDLLERIFEKYLEVAEADEDELESEEDEDE